MQSVFTSICAELANGNVVNIPVNLLKISTELRDVNEEFVSELSFNAMDFGVMQNILVSIDEKDQNFKVLDGNQRVQAAIDLDLEFVPAKLLSTDKPNTALLVSKMSTLTHSTIELALLCKDALTEGAAQKDLAERFNIHKSKVSELIKISELPEDIQQAAKANPKKFNHMTLLKLAKLEGDEQRAEFECIKMGSKKKSARFSTFMKQLEADKLTKKKLTASNVDVLVDTIDTIVQVLTDRQLHADSNTDVGKLRDRLRQLVMKEETPDICPEPVSELEHEKDMASQLLLSYDTEEANNIVKVATEIAA